MLRIFILTAAFLLATGCDLYQYNLSVQVSFPSLPESWTSVFGPIGFRLSYVSRFGEVNHLDFPAHVSSTIITLPKTVNTPVLAEPLLNRSNAEILPAGALFPLHLSRDKTLRLQWEHGFVAGLFLSMRCQGLPLESVNAERLCRQIELEADGNSWSIDGDSIKSGIRYNNLRSYKVRKLPDTDLSLPVEGDNVWFFGNVLAPRLMKPENGVLELHNVYLGFHKLLANDGQGCMDLFVSDEAWYMVNRTAGIAVSGSL